LLAESDLAPHLALAFAPEPDLLIAPAASENQQLPLWQLAYTELYFCDTLWPDFDAAELDRALDWYSTRERRFGMTGEQVAVPPVADAA
jgi:undecaprenyl diphosphate synthase